MQHLVDVTEDPGGTLGQVVGHAAIRLLYLCSSLRLAREKLCDAVASGFKALDGFHHVSCIAGGVGEFDALIHVDV